MEHPHRCLGERTAGVSQEGDDCGFVRRQRDRESWRAIARRWRPGDLEAGGREERARIRWNPH
jgi:hypothetical protein